MTGYHKGAAGAARSFLSALGVVAGFGAAQAGAPAVPPYWASLHDAQVNMRVGPGEDYGLRFVYRTQHLPVKVLRLWQGWALIEDPEGAKGWVLQKLVPRERYAVVVAKSPVAMRAAPDESAQVLWRLPRHIFGKLGDCADGWCKLDVNQHMGFVRQSDLWGAGKP
jgi:SH3-like domain-containing protein